MGREVKPESGVFPFNTLTENKRLHSNIIRSFFSPSSMLSLDTRRFCLDSVSVAVIREPSAIVLKENLCVVVYPRRVNSAEQSTASIGAHPANHTDASCWALLSRWVPGANSPPRLITGFLMEGFPSGWGPSQRGLQPRLLLKLLWLPEHTHSSGVTADVC